TPSPTHQAVKTAPKRSVQTLKVGTVQFLPGKRKCLTLGLVALYQTRFDCDQALGPMPLDHLTDHHLWPGQQTRATALCGRNGRAKGAFPSLDIANQSIRGQQQ